MKKLIAIILCVALAIFCCACGNKNKNDVKDEAQEKSDVNTEGMDLEFTYKDMDSSYDNAIEVKSQNTVKIRDGSTYILMGNYNQIIVDCDKKDKPKIILNGVTVSSSEGPAIYIKSADKVFLTVNKGTENVITDSANYPSSYDNADAAIFSKEDLTINGEGTLSVNGNYKCGIVSKDDLVISDTKILIESESTALEGKDCVKINNANIDINAKTDGIKATNEEDENLGYLYIKSGNFNITSTKDALQSVTALLIDGGNFNITTGGGSQNSSDKNDDWGHWGGYYEQQNNSSTPSSKALKSAALIKINNGTFEIDSSDDAIHSNQDIEITGGTIKISSGDDGIHADDSLIINGGNFKINKSYEGFEATVITVNGGEIDITATDDGINAAGGNDGSSMGGRPGQNPFESDSSASINITGGVMIIDASGDGIDSNGNITVSGGNVYVNGPTNNGNGAFDYGGTAVINGGNIVLVGASGMAQGFSQGSQQPSIMYTLNTNYQGNINVSICDNKGNQLFGFVATKQFKSIVISCDKLKVNNDYILKIGDDEYNITLNSNIYSNGQSGMDGGFGGHGLGGPGGMKPNRPW